MTNDTIGKIFIFVALLLLVPSFVKAQTCTQTFTPSNIGTSPYPGSNVNTAVQNGSGSTVLCFASGTYGEIDIYNAHPSSIVTMKPAPSAAAVMGYINLNGVSNLTIIGFSGSSSIPGGFTISNTGQGDSSNIIFSNNNMGSAEILIRDNVRANANILIDGNKIAGYRDLNDTGAIMVVNTGNSNCPNGVVISNNTIIGSIGDGLSTGGPACGTQFGPGNDISGFIEANCQGVHCDGFQDNGGGQNLIVTGNYFHNLTNCFQITDNDSNLTYTNNVCENEPAAAYTGQMSPQTALFSHNTFVSPGLCIHVGNTSSGAQSSNITDTDNVFNGGQFCVNGGQSVAGTFTQDYNLCPGGGCTGTHSINGTPVFVGGSSPSIYGGFALTSTSPGHLAANDGQDMGIKDTAIGPVPPTSLTATVQ